MRENTNFIPTAKINCEHILAVTDTRYDILDWRDGESEFSPTDSFGYIPNI